MPLISDAKIIAEEIVKGFTKAANSIERSAEINANAILEGFKETARILDKPLARRRAKLMMDCLMKKPPECLLFQCFQKFVKQREALDYMQGY